MTDTDRTSTDEPEVETAPPNAAGEPEVEAAPARRGLLRRLRGGRAAGPVASPRAGREDAEAEAAAELERVMGAAEPPPELARRAEIRESETTGMHRRYRFEYEDVPAVSLGSIGEAPEH